MGKKNKKSRRYNDDDILGCDAPPPDQDDFLDEDDVATATTSSNADADADADDDAPADATDHSVMGAESEDASIPPLPAAAAAAADESPKTKKEKTSKKNAKKNKAPASVVVNVENIDLIRLEETMTEILRNYGGHYQSEDWLHRSMEKNMHLPKRSLGHSLEPHILDQMLDRVQEKLDNEHDKKASDKKRWDDLVEEIVVSSTTTTAADVGLSVEDEMKLRAAACKVGLDPDAAVEKVIETMRAAGNEDVQNDASMGGAERKGSQEDNLIDESLEANTNSPISVSILLALQPHLLQPSSLNQSSLIRKILLMLWQLLCIFIYNMLCLLVGKQTKTQVEQLWEQRHLPAIKAAQLAQEQELDERMLRENTHLWSNQQDTWIEKDATYLPPSTTDESREASDLPPTVRWNNARKQWERWSKNLTTRTKAAKQAAAAGLSTEFTKGTFTVIRVGEGWASAPDEPEVENKQLTLGCIRFFACIPAKDGDLPELVDVTTWAAKTVLPKEAARELDAVDSGKDLFSLDVSSLLPAKQGGKKGKGGKLHKKKAQNNRCADGGEDEGNSVARKGVGCTAIISKKYLDLMQ